MRKYPFVIWSIFISLLIHILFLTTAAYYWIPGVSENIEQTQKLFRINPPKPVALPEVPLEKTAKEKMSFEKPTDELKELAKENSLKETTVDSDVEILPEDQKEQEIQEKTIEKLPQAESQAKKQEAEIKKRETERQSIKVDRAILKDSADSAIEEEGILHIPIEFEEKMHAFTPETLSSSIADQESSADHINWQRYATDSPHFKPTTGYERLDPFLNTQLQIYKDTQTQKNYYELSIYPNAQTEGLPVLRKEIVFLIDASLSIKDYRLHAFKEGIKDALQLLNTGDLFNLYVFQDKIIPFSEKSLPANPITISQAGFFLDRLDSEDRTDIYSAFLETLNKRENLHPSYIILLSDGNATTGVDSTAKLIAQITKKNNGSRPIFAFSGGARVNRFLLDFLAYPNRGWAEYAQKNSQIQSRFKDVNQKIKHPVLTEIQYQFSGVQENEVFPKNLPDFYRDAVFTLYGQFEENEDLFSIRITGKNLGVNQEFIYSNHLIKATSGGPEIARAWAFNKVYYLISQMTLNGSDKESKEEIQKLLTEFDLQIPYEFESLVQ